MFNKLNADGCPGCHKCPKIQIDRIYEISAMLPYSDLFDPAQLTSQNG